MKSDSIRWPTSSDKNLQGRSQSVLQQRQAKESNRKKLDNIFRTTQEEERQINTVNKKNESCFQKGFVIDHNPKPRKVVFHQKNQSTLVFDDSPKPLLTERNRQASKSPFNRTASQSRNPIIGSTNDNNDNNSQNRKKLIEYKPSKTYDTLNKKKYMLSSDMKPLSELYNSKKGQMAIKKMQSSIPIGSQVEQQQSQQAQNDSLISARAKKTQGLGRKSQMGDVLGYKDALQYREDFMSTKINQEKHQEIVKNTVQQLIDSKSEQRMTKGKELSSQIF